MRFVAAQENATSVLSSLGVSYLTLSGALNLLVFTSTPALDASKTHSDLPMNTVRCVADLLFCLP